MENLYETIEYRGHNINIYYDEYPMNPRTEWDNAGTMVCFHNRYDLGDKHQYSDENFMEELAIKACPGIEELISYWEDGPGWERFNNVELSDRMIEKAVKKVIEKYHIGLNLYLYDHSGITMSTTGFSCPWDSGQVGWIFISKKDAEKEGWDEDQAIKYLKGEVETYDNYLTGQVFGYVVEAKDCNKGIDCDDSCWGYYGDEEIEYMTSEAKRAIDYEIEQYKEKVGFDHEQKMLLNWYYEQVA